MLKKISISMALAAGIIATTPSPAQAIPPGESLIVTTYYSDAGRTQIIGQKWHGCGDPSGSWGTTSTQWAVSFVLCDY